jgi:arginyl-tRNA synthetase
VLQEGEDKAALRAARLALTDATRVTLAAGLTLLGVATPETM